MVGNKNSVQDKETKFTGASKLVGETRPLEKNEADKPLVSDTSQSASTMNEQDTILSDYFSSLLGPTKQDPVDRSSEKADEATRPLKDNECTDNLAESSSASVVDDMMRESPCFDTSIASNRLLSIPQRPHTIPFVPAYITAVRALQCLFELLGFLRTALPPLVRKSFLERCDEMMMLFRFSRQFNTMRAPHER